jgi:hypothetical protein
MDKHLIWVREHVDASEIAGKLGLETPAAIEFINFALANAILFDKKQQDYGSENIADFGSFGCVVRANDKFKRLKNLFMNRRRKVVNEKIIDSFRDASNYCIIAWMWEDGKWK